MSVREGIDFGTTVTTDSAPLHRLVAAMLAAVDDPDGVHTLRDPTRGGLVAATVEIARTAGVGIELDEATDPGARDGGARRAASWVWTRCRWPTRASWSRSSTPRTARRCWPRCGRGPEGAGAVIIGRVVAEHPGMVVGRTPFGTTRVIERELGEQLPRIC